jgi:hypothetical protein
VERVRVASRPRRRSLRNRSSYGIAWAQAAPGILMDFGESGKNFIEIGKRRNVQETMIRRAMPLEADGIPRHRRHNAEAQTWK